MSIFTRHQPVPRYEDPTLHPGEWGEPEVITGRSIRVKWERTDGFVCDGRDMSHRATLCTIGPNMAHVDICACGAERYGVFGAWSSPRT